MLKINDCKKFELNAKKSAAREATAAAKVEAESYVQAINLAKARIVYFITAEASTEAGFNERILRNVYGIEGALRNAPGKTALYNKINLAKWLAGQVDFKEVATAEDVDSKIDELAALYPSYNQALRASKNKKEEKNKAGKAEAGAVEKSQKKSEFKAEGESQMQAIKNVITRIDELVKKGYFSQAESAELLESVKSLSKHLAEAGKPKKQEKTKAKIVKIAA